LQATRLPLQAEMNLSRFLKYWLPAILWMVLIFVGSTDLMSAEQTSHFLVPFLRWLKPDISIETLNTMQFAIRKIAHVTEYGVLAWLLWRAFRARTFSKHALWKLASSALLISACYAALDEFHQSFVITRTASVHDVMIDIVGAMIAIVTCWGATHLRQHRLTT
jgi:VanZ family protein